MPTASYPTRLRQGFRNQLAWGGAAFADPIFYMLCSFSLFGWFYGMPDHRLTLAWIAFKALFEEFFFRFLLQVALSRVLPSRWRLGPVSSANLIASLCFAGMHIFKQPLEWAVITFIPSLAFGYAWDRYRSILPCWIIHFFYNTALFFRPF